MKAIEILFEELDNVSTKIRNADTIPLKLNNLEEMRDLIKLIGKLSEYQLHNHKEDYL